MVSVTFNYMHMQPLWRLFRWKSTAKLSQSPQSIVQHKHTSLGRTAKSMWPMHWCSSNRKTLNSQPSLLQRGRWTLSSSSSLDQDNTPSGTISWPASESFSPTGKACRQSRPSSISKDSQCPTVQPWDDQRPYQRSTQYRSPGHRFPREFNGKPTRTSPPSSTRTQGTL